MSHLTFLGMSSATPTPLRMNEKLFLSKQNQPEKLHATEAVKPHLTSSNELFGVVTSVWDVLKDSPYYFVKHNDK
jgi:hypothetical protein